MELIDKGEVIKIVNKHLMAYENFDSETELLTSIMEAVLNADGVEKNTSTPQSVINFFIDEEQAKKYIKAIIKTDADNQIKFINYHAAGDASSETPASPHYCYC